MSLHDRTKSFALRIIRLYTKLPKTTEAQVLGKQVLRSGTSIGAYYREASRSRSPAEYISKTQLATQELEETGYWLELLIEAEIVPPEKLQPLIVETREMIAIFVTLVRKAREKE
jgi:four helix bundle protein